MPEMRSSTSFSIRSRSLADKLSFALTLIRILSESTFGKNFTPGPKVKYNILNENKTNIVAHANFLG